jgi:hypothetical protein
MSTARELILGTSANPGVVPLVRATWEATIAIRTGTHERLRGDGTAGRPPQAGLIAGQGCDRSPDSGVLIIVAASAQSRTDSQHQQDQWTRGQETAAEWPMARVT